jgi:DNA-binding transcriptional LysR family regulator
MHELHGSMRVSQTADSRPTVRELEILAAVIAAGKTTAASAQLGMSQPAVSRALQSLERRLGRALFRREGGTLAPTGEAMRLAERGGTVLAMLDAMAGDGPGPASGSVRLIAPPSITEFFLGAAVARFVSLHPETLFQVEVAPSGDVISQVAEGRSDLGVTDTFSAHPGVRRIVIRRAEAHVLVRSDHRLARRTRLGVEDLAGEPLIALSRRFHVRSRIDEQFRAIGVAPTIVSEVATATLARSLVLAGVGVTILNPFPLSLRPDRDAAFVPFDPPIRFETTVLVSPALPLPMAAVAFLDFLRREQPEDGLTTALR